jgi:hypothetical protein
MMPLQLKKVLRTMGTKKVFLVHTENAELFEGFMRDLKSKVTLVEKSKEYVL